MSTIRITLLGTFAVSVDGRAVADAAWTRRHAAGMVKALALAGPDHRLHREQLLDRLWPDDTIDEAGPKLHKAAHYARRALALPGAIVLRDGQVQLAPGHEVTVDVAEFEAAARAARPGSDPAVAGRALALYGGELLPQDRYEEWVEERREQLRRRQVDLLRLAGRWDEVLEQEPSDEAAHLAAMQRHVAAGDRHAALRQFERLDRALRQELGVAPGREAVALRDRLRAGSTERVGTEAGTGATGSALVGRDAERSVLDRALAAASTGASRTLLVTGPTGVGKSALLVAATARAREIGFRVGVGACATLEGAWPYAPVVEALADLCRRHPSLLDGLHDEHREEIDRALARTDEAWGGGSAHQRLFVATAELVRLAGATTGVLLVIDDVHDADDASLRLVHYVARSTRDQRVCIVLSHRPAPGREILAETRRSLLGRHGAIEIELGPLAEEAAAALARVHLPPAAGPDDDVVDRIVVLSGCLPFAVRELARRAGDPGATLDAGLLSGVPPTTREMLQRVAVVGLTFDTDELVALSGRPEEEAFDHLDAALAAAIVEPAPAGYRFRHALVRDALLDEVPPHRRRRIHRDAADRLIGLGASSARIGHHLLQAGAADEAARWLLRAASTEAAIGAYRDALALVDAVLPHAGGPERSEALALRADLLNAVGDPMATAAYREALAAATAGSERGLRARLARSAVMSGDLDTAAAVIDGLQTDGGVDDVDILLARASYAFFTFDLAMASDAIDQARNLVLAGQRSWKVLDLISLQGMLAHLSGNWFDQMRQELRRTRDNPEVANAIFDAYLCPAEYLLYGATPYREVIELAGDLKVTARRSGALRAVAFASALIGEAALLSGDLARAETELAESRDLHHDLGSTAGESHSLQRLAEARLAAGDREGARELLAQAHRLARHSTIANHLLHRIFGSMVVAADSPADARAVVDRAEATLGWDEDCLFCSIMLSVPAAIACAAAGDLDHARHHLGIAERSSVLWQGTSWEAALIEARAAVTRAEGDPPAADALLRAAADQFEQAGQPLDAARCRRAPSR